MGAQETAPANLTRLALTVAAGVGGVVALVVAYRRQRDLEQGRFVEGFGAAAKQLGDADVAVKMAGAYAMAGVADQSSKLKRQQCIDVLCGYLRLPYSPELGNNHQSGLTLKKPAPHIGAPEEELQFQYRQNDKEVRQPSVRVIAAHLQEKAAASWSSNDFDFTGSHLEGADLSGAIFNGANTSFREATFSSKNTWFREAIFSGANTSLDTATFSGGTTSFYAAMCSASTVFYDATFSGKHTTFEEAAFSGNTSFDGAAFNGKPTSFRTVDFGGGRVRFNNPKVWSPAPAFDWDTGGEALTPKPRNVEPQDWPPSPEGGNSCAGRWLHFRGRHPR